MLNNLQNLRAIACYAVVVYHCLIRFVQPTEGLALAYLDLPSAGVDLFFVISGFVMVYTTKDDETSSWFFTKRVARIVPLYWTATLLVVLLATIRSWTFPLADLAPDSILAALFFIPHSDLTGEAYPILGVGWTLNYEMMFYALFALSLMLPRGYRLPGVLALITAVWASAVLTNNNLIAHFYANPIIFEFAAGCVIAHALRTKTMERFVKCTPMWPLAAVGVIALLVLPAFIPIQLPTIARYGAPVMLIAFAAAAQDMYRTPTKETLLTRLGDASYSAYLLHPIIIMVVGTALTHTVGESMPTEFAILAIVVVVTAIVSLVSLKVFERPSATLVRRLLKRRRAAPGH